jgi:hypothetical protein
MYKPISISIILLDDLLLSTIQMMRDIWYNPIIIDIIFIDIVICSNSCDLSWTNSYEFELNKLVDWSWSLMWFELNKLIN